MNRKIRKVQLDEGSRVKGGVNQGKPSTPRPPKPVGQGGKTPQNTTKNNTNS